MMSQRRCVAIVLVAAAPLLLSGCTKPKPGVTVFSGTASEHEAAVCWQFEPDAALTPRECAEDVLAAAAAGTGIPSLQVSPGNIVGISVDPVVAESGWSVQIAGQPVATDLTETYHRFTFPEQVPTGGSGFTLQVQAAADAGGVRGHWFFQLVPG